MAFCHVLDFGLLTLKWLIKNPLSISIIFYVVPESQECGLERIAPLKQNSEGSWIDLNSNEVADLDGMWLQGQPNGKDIQNCATFFASTGRQHF